MKKKPKPTVIYTINGKVYELTTRYIQEDKLYESALENNDERFLAAIGYGETEKESIQELKDRLWEKGIMEGENNHYLSWEDLSPEIRHKIIVYSKGVKSELMGKWMNDADRYQEWRKKVLDWTSREYGYTTPPTYGDYRRL